MTFVKGNKPWNTGKSWAEEIRVRISKNKKGKKINYHRTPEGNANIRAKQPHLFKSGHTPWNKGKSWPMEMRKRISETEKRIGHCPSDDARQKAAIAMKTKEYSLEYRQMLAERGKKQIVTPEMRRKMSVSHKGVPLSKHHRDAIGRAGKKRFMNIEHKILHVHKIRSGCSKIRPTKPEQILWQLIQTVCPNEYRYVGNGDFVIGGKIPDFVDVDGKKNVIEMYGDYWHQGENPQNRIDLYKEYGFNCLVVWEKELKDKKSVIMRLREFNGITQKP